MLERTVPAAAWMLAMTLAATPAAQGPGQAPTPAPRQPQGVTRAAESQAWAQAPAGPPDAAVSPAIPAGKAAAKVTEKDEAAKQVDALFAPWSATDSPGCAVAVVRDGRIVYSRGYGMANLDLDVAIRPSTVFNVASMSKQFTAASLVLLAQAGKLTLDDDVRKYVPELPRYEQTITIRHLLQHTSGLRDFIDLMAIGGRPLDSVYTLEQTVDLIARQQGLNFAPGSQYLYSNSGYILLLAIVERVTGEKFGRFVEQRIFAPLGMTHSRVYDDRAMIVKDRATGYFTRADGRLGGRMSAWQIPGDGGVLTTVEDLFLWDQAFYQPDAGGVINADLIAQLTTAGTLRDGSPLEYGLGLRVESYRGLRLISHSGGIGGFGTQMLRFPERRFSAICLCNTGDANPTALTRRIADIYLFDNTPGPPIAAPVTQAPASGPAAPTPAATLDTHAGEYWSDEVDTGLTVRLRDGKLWIERRYAEPMALSPIASGEDGGAAFRAARYTVTFHGADLLISSGRAKNVRFTRRTAASATAPKDARSR